MFTTIDKALVAIVMAGVFLLREVTGIELGLTEDVVNTFIVGITPILVWLIPNRGSN